MTADLHCKLHPKQITLKDILKWGLVATAGDGPDVSGTARGPLDDILSLSLTFWQLHYCAIQHTKKTTPYLGDVLFSHLFIVSLVYAQTLKHQCVNMT